MQKDLITKVGGFKFISYEEKIGIADYGLDKDKLVYMIAEKQ